MSVETDFLDAQVAYQSKIHTFARNSYHQIPGYSIDDMEQETLIVLWKCVQRYNPDAGATFNTFFWQSARNNISDMTSKAMTQKRQTEWFSPLSPVEILDEDSFTMICDQYLTEMSAEDWSDLRETVIEKWEELTPKQRLRIVS